MIGMKQALEAPEPAHIVVEARAKKLQQEAFKNGKLPSQRPTLTVIYRIIILYIFMKL